MVLLVGWPGDALPDDTPAQREFKRQHRTVRKNWQLPPSFPAPAVLEAYLQPRLDPNKAKFSFGRPDLQLLRQFCGWGGVGRPGVRGSGRGRGPELGWSRRGNCWRG